MNILITGTSTGFGKLMVKTLSGDGCGHNIIAAMRNVTDENAGPAVELSALPGVEVMEMDVTDQSQVDAAVSAVLEKYGSIDVVVNNAGIFGKGLMEAYSIGQFQKIFDINFYGPLRLMKAVLPSMRINRDGLIINISSSLGLVAIPLLAPYCASKHALEALVRASYYELIQMGVENILLEPGAFPTELSAKAGVPADEIDIIASYHGLQDRLNAKEEKVMDEKMPRVKPDPQAVVDRTVELIHMKKGTRPIRSIVDAIAGSALTMEIESALLDLENRWKAAYG